MTFGAGLFPNGFIIEPSISKGEDDSRLLI